MIVFALFSCAPGPGEPGYIGCDPIPVDEDCLIWQCYEVQDDRSVKYWYDYRDEIGYNCDGYDCSAAFERAAEDACGMKFDT